MMTKNTSKDTMTDNPATSLSTLWLSFMTSLYENGLDNARARAQLNFKALNEVSEVMDRNRETASKAAGDIAENYMQLARSAVELSSRAIAIGQKMTQAAKDQSLFGALMQVEESIGRSILKNANTQMNRFNAIIGKATGTTSEMRESVPITTQKYDADLSGTDAPPVEQQH